VVTKISVFVAVWSALLSFDVQSANCDASAPCIVKVSPATPSGACSDGTVNNDPVTLVNRNTRKNIVWRLPNNYQFCKAAGDGVFLKTTDDDNQFDSMYATDDPNGGTSPSKPCKQHYHWGAKHTVSKPSAPYKYVIIFRDASGQNRYCIDPSIVNG
jgi:hypothetical protein